MTSKPMFSAVLGLTVTLMVGSVAVNWYQTSCDAFGPHAGADSIVAPLNEPETVTQEADGVSVIALVQLSFCADARQLNKRARKNCGSFCLMIKIFTGKNNNWV